MNLTDRKKQALIVAAWLVVGLVSFALSGDPFDGLLSAGIGLAVSLLVLAVFSESGRVQLSPQREVALATGHSDRRTLFESPYLRHVMWVLLSLSHRLNMPRIKAWLRKNLISEGNLNYYTPEEYFAVALAAGLGAGMFLELIFVLLAEGSQFSFLMFILGVMCGLFLMLFSLYERARKRLRQISKRVPYTLDLISLAMGAGATFTEAVGTVVHEDAEEPFNVELRTVLSEIELGSTRRTALQNLADRVPLDNLRSIVASVIQAEELGTPLADVLHSQASLLRQQRSMRAENAAAVASVRILVPALLILMSVVLAVFGPMILRIFRGGLF